MTGYSPQGSAELFVPFAALERARAVQSAVTAPENGGQLPGEPDESDETPPETASEGMPPPFPRQGRRTPPP